MNKSFRQGQILKIIRAKEIYTQDELARELGGLGINTTQVTLSRDMRELGLVKTVEGYRQLTNEAVGPHVEDVLNEYLQDVRVAQNLVVLKTSPGNASTLAVSLDRQNDPDIVGTVAGDDTILVITSDHDAADRLRRKILEMISAQ
jgi:transcriptional regulator of arginine metabolism